MGKINNEMMYDRILQVEEMLKQAEKSYIDTQTRMNLLSLENAKLIERLDRAINLGFKV